MEIITTHKNTDFDALASVVGASLLYPSAIPVIPRNVNPNVKAFLAIHKDLLKLQEPSDIDLKEVKKLIVVDTNRWERLEKFGDLKKRDDIEIIVWDHHPGPGDIEALESHISIVGANVSIIAEQLKQQNKRLSQIEATLLLAGLYEDTGNLSFPSATAKDAYAAGYLMENNADLEVINTFLRHSYGYKQKDLLFSMLNSAERINVGGHKISISIKEIDGHVDGLAVLVKMYREILNVDAAFGIFAEKNRDAAIVIARSASTSINAGTIMRAFGGGGHPGAGSSVVKSKNIHDIGHRIKELIGEKKNSAPLIGDLMSFPVYTVETDTTMQKISDLLSEKGCTGFPVIDKNKEMAGVISRRDLKKIKKKEDLALPVKAFMSTKKITITPDKSPLNAAELMIKHDIGRLPVIENGKLTGIVTRSDIMIYIYDLLPE